MVPTNETDKKAEEWFWDVLEHLQYEQDYTVCVGHSKDLLDKEGGQRGIAIRRPYIRLFSTGLTKIYQMTVLGEKLPKVEYTEAEEKELDAKLEKAELEHEELWEK